MSFSKCWVVAAAFALATALGVQTAATGGLASRPTDDSQVLLELRPGGLSARERELRAWRQELQENPANLPLALRLGERLLQLARSAADPRYLGQAEAVLAPWWSSPGAPAEVLLLRATAEQHRHDFEGALRTLERALTANPRLGGAWLTKATLLTLRGDYPAARRSCLPLARLVDPVTALTAGAVIAGVTGEAGKAWQTLTNVLARPGPATPEALGWAHAAAADLAERLGRVTEAEHHFRAALRMVPGDPFVVAGLADFLLEQKRPAEVLTLLEPAVGSDALGLRLAEARRAVRGVVDPQDLRRLQEGFAAGRRRGLNHAREEARFHLTLVPQPALALRLARENWAQQREPADVRLLLAAGRAAGDAGAVAEARDWVRTNRLEDALFQRLDSTQ